MSYMVEVQADNSGKWCGNGIRLATYLEAFAYGRDLYSRWVLVKEIRVVESPDPVNYTFKDGQLESIPAEPCTMVEVIQAGASA